MYLICNTKVNLVLVRSMDDFLSFCIIKTASECALVPFLREERGLKSFRNVKY